MTRKPDWYKFATTRDLIEGLSDPSTEGSERSDVAMFVHGRILRPFLGINLLFMSLPLVLGGYGRNAFINLGFALANSAMFYGAIIFCQYLGSFGIFSPPMSAWAPCSSSERSPPCAGDRSGPDTTSKETRSCLGV